MDLCNLNELKPLLKKYGFTFSKSLGQNFLCDAAVPYEIAENANIDKNTCVLEVGPGVGALTQELCGRAHSVVSVELDRRLFPLLQETVGHFDNFSLAEGDILKVNIKDICKSFEGKKTVACANLPYYITSPAITALIESQCFESITVMVQKEVAERICAKPGKKDYGAFTLFVRYHAEPVLVTHVTRDCFVPSPNVDSAVVRLDMRKTPPVSSDKDLLFKTIRCAFAQRRKTMANCLCSAFRFEKSEAEEILLKAGLKTDARGETLSIDEFAALCDVIEETVE